VSFPCPWLSALGSTSLVSVYLYRLRVPCRILVLVVQFLYYVCHLSMPACAVLENTSFKFIPLPVFGSFSHIPLDHCVTLSFDFLHKRSSDRLHTWRVYRRGPEEVQYRVVSVKLFGWAVLGKVASGNTGGQAIGPLRTGALRTDTALVYKTEEWSHKSCSPSC